MATSEKTSANSAQESQYLTFTLGDELFALAIPGIKEIIEYGQVTVVPLMPDYVRGVINLRGAVVPVVDLAARFGQPRSQVSRRSCTVIIEVHGRAVGGRRLGGAGHPG
jgi:purine-binding chemotaxis protein CheW